MKQKMLKLEREISKFPQQFYSNNTMGDLCKRFVGKS